MLLSQDWCLPVSGSVPTAPTDLLPTGLAEGRKAELKTSSKRGRQRAHQLTDLSFDHDYRLQRVQGRCLPDSATPCGEAVNKQREGRLFEYFTFGDNKPLNV